VGGTPELRKQTRDRLQGSLDATQPDIVFGHSLGSLICYDLFTQNPDAVKGRVFVSFGSQINNGFVRGVFAGGVRPLPPEAFWVHLYNPDDWMFTAEFGADMPDAANFRQYLVPFDEGWIGSHTDMHRYLNDPAAPDAWLVVHDWFAAPAVAGRVRSLALGAPAPVPLPPRNERRALLIGVNKYAAANIPTLEGCVNDVFLVSAALQENGVAPEEIRVVLDERATSDGIRERLGWLFDDVRDDDVRLLYFSGHGAILPVYNAEGEPDRLLDALVPADFDGSTARAITDRDLAPYYEQLPRKARLILAFDCCRSPAGAATGGAARGIELPDDIRHRMLRWNADEQMWQLRDFPPLLPGTPPADGPDWRVQFSGKRNCSERLGRSVVRRTLPDAAYDELRAKSEWGGPYLPVIIEACAEEESAAEYLHGTVSYGAFSYAFCQTLRTARIDRKQPSFEELVRSTRRKMHRLGYPQTPEILGPKEVLRQPIPLVPPPGRRTRNAAKPP
jgi:pimeloyl-ACP methyl ester carboxylesterase